MKQLHQWAQQPLTQPAAQDIVHAVKAKYDDDQWLARVRKASEPDEPEDEGQLFAA